MQCEPAQSMSLGYHRNAVSCTYVCTGPLSQAHDVLHIIVLAGLQQKKIVKHAQSLLTVYKQIFLVWQHPWLLVLGQCCIACIQSKNCLNACCCPADGFQTLMSCRAVSNDRHCVTACVAGCCHSCVRFRPRHQAEASTQCEGKASKKAIVRKSKTSNTWGG